MTKYSRTFCAMLFLAITGVRSLSAQSQCGLGPSDMKAAAKAAAAVAHGDRNAFLKELDRRVLGEGKKIADHETIMQSAPLGDVVHSLNVYLQGPYQAYRLLAAEAVRTMDPVDRIEVPPGFTFLVTADKITALDISKIVVERDDQIVEPVQNGLEVHDVASRIGAHAGVHEGVVLYSCATFAPGGTVKITLIPVHPEPALKNGRYVKALDAKQLDSMK